MSGNTHAAPGHWDRDARGDREARLLRLEDQIPLVVRAEVEDLRRPVVMDSAAVMPLASLNKSRACSYAKAVTGRLSKQEILRIRAIMDLCIFLSRSFVLTRTTEVNGKQGLVRANGVLGRMDKFKI
jgi:hypothetical protein